jgi:translocation and assembly module TamA
MPALVTEETPFARDAGRRSGWLLALLAAGSACASRADANEASPYIAFNVAIEAPAPLQQPIERGLNIRSWQGFEYVTPELLDQLAEAARQQTRNTLETEGYFAADISTRIDTSVEPRVVRISVQPGEPARIESVVVEFTGAAAADPALASRLERIRADWRLPRGATFTQEDWTRAKSAIVADLASVSFASARMTESLARVEADLRNVNLRVAIDSGPPFYFGTISVTGLQRHSPELVENFAPFAPGTPYSLEQIRRYERRLAVTGYFSSVQAVLDTDPAVADSAPVTVGVIEALPRRIDATLGFSTDTLARLGVAYTDNDFLGRALRMRTDLRVESLRQGLTAGIERPPGRSGWIDAYTGAVLRTDIQDLITNEWTFAAQRRRLNERNEPAFGVEWTTEVQKPRGAPETSAFATMLGYQHTWRALDDLLSPTQGWMLRLNAGVAPPGISSRAFGQLLASGTYYHALSPRDHLRFRADAGWVVSNTSRDIPQHFLFRTGGDTTVRGYEYQSLGVEVGTAIVGGRYLGIGSAEYTRWVGDNWGIAGFVDAGNATDDLDDFHIAVGYGLGMRVRSPVGAFRFDLAYGRDTSSVRLHFSLGVRF